LRHLFVLNPKSFIHIEDIKEFLLSTENCFSTGKREEYRIYISRYPRDAIAAVHRYVSAVTDGEPVRIYAVGGDGILFDCLNGMVEFPNAELASVPYGNSNDFLRAFGNQAPMLFRNIKKLSQAPTVLTDIYQCNTIYGMNSGSLGVEASAILHMTHIANAFGKNDFLRSYIHLLYNIGGIRSILNKEERNQFYELTIDGKDYSGVFPLINIGNNHSNGGSNSPNPYAIVNDGLLNALLVKTDSALGLIGRVQEFTQGRYERHPDHYIHTTFKELHAKSDTLICIAVDGETFFTSEVHVRILPKAIKVAALPGLHYVNGKEA
jgi:diacylglycerol kinase family enzyme